MKPNNWVSPAPLDSTNSLNTPIEPNAGESEIKGERKPSQKQAISSQIDERKGPATHVTKPSKKRHKGK